MRRLWKKRLPKARGPSAKKRFWSKVKSKAKDYIRRGLEAKLMEGDPWYPDSVKKGIEAWHRYGKNDQLQKEDLRLRDHGPGSVTTPGKGETRTVKIRTRSAGSTFSYFRTRHRYAGHWKDLMKRVLPKQIHLENYQTKCSSSLTGCQAYVSLANVTQGDIQTLFGKATMTGFSEIYLRRLTSEIMFTNVSNTNVFVDLYEIRCRKGSSVFPVNCFKAGITALTLDPYTYGLVPFDNPTFCREWKVLKRYTVELEEGRSHMHRSLYMLCKKFEYEDVITNTTNVNIPGTTHSVFMIVRGGPGLQGTDTTKSTTTQFCLSITQAVRFEWSYVQPKEGLTTTSYLSQSTTPAKIEDESVGGAPTNVIIG